MNHSQGEWEKKTEIMGQKVFPDLLFKHKRRKPEQNNQTQLSTWLSQPAKVLHSYLLTLWSLYLKSCIHIYTFCVF